MATLTLAGAISSSAAVKSPRFPLAKNFRYPNQIIQCAAREERCGCFDSCCSIKEMRNVACGLLAAWALTAASPVFAANQRLPPLSTESNRCERAFVGNTIGQANGVYDKPLDLRFCDYTNEKSNLKGKSLAAALMSDAKFDGADMSEVVMSKAYAVGASFKGVDFSNAVIDRVNFGKANLQGAVFKNTVLSGSTFDNAQLQDAVFEDTIIGYIDLQKLCTNSTINEEGRAELGCRILFSAGSAAAAEVLLDRNKDPLPITAGYLPLGFMRAKSP